MTSKAQLRDYVLKHPINEQAMSGDEPQLQWSPRTLRVYAQSKFEEYVEERGQAIAPDSSSTPSLTKDFVPGADPDAAVPSLAADKTEPSREPLKHLLIGSPKAVTSTIHALYMLGYADIRDWSPLLPSPNPGEVMSILSRSILVK